MQRKNVKLTNWRHPYFSDFCWMVWGAGKFVVKTARVYRVKGYLGSEHQVFILNILRSCASSLCTPVSFISICKTSHILSTSVLIILSFGLSSIFHVLTSTSSCVFLATWPNHLSLTSLCLQHLLLQLDFQHIS